MISKDSITGHNTHQYTVIKDWGVLDKEKYPVNDCHEMVMDSRGRLFMLTNEVKNNILIYDKSGRLLGSWGHDYPGGHGLTIGKENGKEFLLITDYIRHQVIKTSLEGEVLMVLDYPKETGMYKSADEYKPTETAVAPNGDIYVADGYGLQYVIQYNSRGEYIRHWGGSGSGDEFFDCVHGVTIDNRKPGETVLLLTSRNHNVFKRFTTEGKYISTIHIPGSFVCRPVVHKKNIYAAVFRSGSNQNPESGFITILDENNTVISTPGGTAPVYIDGKLQPQQKADRVFIHPHDVCIDDEDNLYIPQWASRKTYPVKLQRIK